MALSSLQVVRLFGKYIHMMQTLESIADVVVEALVELFEFYVFAAYKMFHPDQTMPTAKQPAKHPGSAGSLKATPFKGGAKKLGDKMKSSVQMIRTNASPSLRRREKDQGQDTPPRLTLLLSRMHSEFGPKSPEASRRGSGGDEAATPAAEQHQFVMPLLSQMVQLKATVGAEGLVERMVVAESLSYIGEVVDELRPHLQRATPNSNHRLVRLLEETIPALDDVRDGFYTELTRRAADFTEIKNQIGNCKWDVKVLDTQHHAHIDQLIDQIEGFKKLIAELHLGMDITRRMWRHVMAHANHAFVDGYAAVKKCTNEGRGMMMVDFQVFTNKSKVLANTKALDTAYTEEYLRAFYLQEEADIEQWIRDHPQYRPRHFHAIITHAAYLQRKPRQRLEALVDNGYCSGGSV